MEDAATPEARQAEAVVDELTHTAPADKAKLAIDQKLLLAEVQMLLAEKRTAFALLRTGVVVGMVPLSLWTVLLATSRLWNVFEVLWLLVPLLAIAGLLFVLGVYAIWHAVEHWRHTERVLAGLRQADTLLGDLMYKELGTPMWRASRRMARRIRGRGT